MRAEGWEGAEPPKVTLSPIVSSEATGGHGLLLPVTVIAVMLYYL